MRGLAAACAAVALITLSSASAALAQDTLSATCSPSDGQSGSCTSRWFTSPVTLEWATDSVATSSTPCLLGIGYDHAQDENDIVSCTASFPDGTSDTRTVHLRIEVTTPTATATADRAPDANGWYNHAVTVSFAGSAFSGIAACSSPQTYAGPAGSGVSISGICTDNAGKTATAMLPINYDASPPTATLSAGPDGPAIDLHWSAASAPAALASVQLVRTAGPGTPGSVISSSAVGNLIDSAVTPGVAYTYALTATDVAGNTTTQSATATVPVPPATTATHRERSRTSPPLLRWRPVRGATYYNVQLYRGHKILSLWPRVARLRLHRSWRYGGRRQALRPGRYRWYVWPGYGPRPRDRYGRLAASGSFVIP